MEKNRVYKCPNCNADLRFDPASGKVVCDYCGAVLDPADYDEKTGKFRKKEEKEQEGSGKKEDRTEDNSGFWQNKYDEDPSLIEMTEFHCTQCGAKLYATDVTISTFCSYCGSHATLEARTVKSKRPDFIIPFSVDKEGCEKAYKKLLKKAIFVPKYMKEDTEIENFRGIYMPYWVYELVYDRDFSVRGSTSRRRGDYVYTKHYVVSTDLKADYDGVNFDASSAFADNLSGAIAPFDLKEGGSYDPVYLSGFYADAGDVYAGTYREDAIETVRDTLADRIYSESRIYANNHVPRDEIKDRIPEPDVRNKKALFPVWFLAIRNKNEDRLSYAVVNGQTGKAAAELPIDFKKYLLGSLILSVPIFFLLLSFLTLTPTAMLVASIVLSLIALIIAHVEINRVYTRENALDDKGLMSLRPEKMKAVSDKDKKQHVSGIEKALGWVGIIIGGIVTLFFLFELGGDLLLDRLMFFLPVVIFGIIVLINTIKKKLSDEAGAEKIERAPRSKKTGVDIKLLTGILACVVTLFIAPTLDAWYYGAAAVSMLLTAWSFSDILRAYNQLTTRKLPQFDTRGGDQDAVS